MTNLYSNLIVRYVYGETNDVLKSGVKRLLQKDSELKELFFRLKESKQMLKDLLPMQLPKKSTVENILKYAAR